MDSQSEKPSLKLTIKLPKRENDRADSTDHLGSNLVEDKDPHPSLSALPQSECGETPRANESNQLVLYNPEVNCSEPSHVRHSSSRRHSASNVPHRVLPSVGAFTVQCANCFKWRLIPTIQKYEQIREHILEQPFLCETAREWRPDITCDDPEDISQDGSRLWAIDKPNIAQPPPGWKRQLRIRAEGGCRFADVYYVAPSGKRLRSMVEIQKFLDDHPEYISNGVTLSQFSFQTPKPLNEDYVRKRPAQKPTSQDAHPLSMVGPDSSTDLQLGTPALPPPPIYSEASDIDSVGQAVKRAKFDS